MMNTAKKTILLVVCAALVVCASVMGTLAYLQMQTKPVVNTMTVGNVTITLDESKVTEYGVLVPDAAPVTENTYKLIPGHKYVKNPVVHVAADSEACYVFVEVVNGIADIEGGTTIAEQMANYGWTAVNGVENVYYTQVNAEDAKTGKDLPVFDEFTINTDIDNIGIEAYDGKLITVTAYAIQADGFANAETAWNTGFGNSNP